MSCSLRICRCSGCRWDLPEGGAAAREATLVVGYGCGHLNSLSVAIGKSNWRRTLRLTSLLPEGDTRCTTTPLRARFGSPTCPGRESRSIRGGFFTGQPFDRHRRVRVWRVEEKKTDVNMAVRMYRDVCRGLYDRIVVVTNDSDFEPALEAIREDFPEVVIGVVMPIRPAITGASSHRRPCNSLAAQAHWSLTSLSDELLASAQLSPVVPTRKKPIRKPVHW
ncbi:NYN domain-containing protein [Roseateles sp.]|uniref:NYN domain-containing protein n=1 Tax=Roseateles sp. TaxID=1971397 RepID=UPI0031D04A51